MAQGASPRPERYPLLAPPAQPMAALQAATHRTFAACGRLQPALRGLRAAWAPARQPGAAAAQLQRRAAASRVVMASAETEVAGGSCAGAEACLIAWPPCAAGLHEGGVQGAPT